MSSRWNWKRPDGSELSAPGAGRRALAFKMYNYEIKDFYTGHKGPHQWAYYRISDSSTNRNN